MVQKVCYAAYICIFRKHLLAFMEFGGRYGFGSVSVRIRCICETFHIHTETEPKPNRNRTEKLKCLKPYGRFHICAETETEPKPNAEPKTCTNLILFFSVSVAEFQQRHSKRRPNISFQDRLSLNAGQKYCRML